MSVALLRPSQHESMIDLLHELHVYYNADATIDRAIVSDHFSQNLLPEASGIQLVVASRDDGNINGFAAISLVYSLVEPTPQERRYCALRELFVSASDRSEGVGKALMIGVARYAADNGCCRIDWPVNAFNPRGIAFYESLGAQPVAERLSYRLSGENFIALAGAADAA